MQLLMFLLFLEHQVLEEIVLVLLDHQVLILVQQMLLDPEMQLVEVLLVEVLVLQKVEPFVLLEVLEYLVMIISFLSQIV